MGKADLGVFVTAVYVATYLLIFGYGAYLLWRATGVGRED